MVVLEDCFENENLYSEEFKYAMYFDTIVMLKKILLRDCEIRDKSEYGIKGLDVAALMMIGVFPNKSMSFYSQKLNVENGSFNYISNKLVNLGLADIVLDKKDKRKKVLVLTEKGKEVCVYHRKLMNKHIEEKLECLSEEERRLFASSINTIRALAFKLDQ